MPRPSWCARPPRTCSDEQTTGRGAVRRGRRRQTGARPEPRPAGRRTARGRQHRRRFRASWTLHLARYRHADLCSRWSRQSRYRLGPARRDVVVHGLDRRARRRGLVSARRSRSRAACRAHPQVAPGAATIRGDIRHLPPPRHRAPRGAHELDFDGVTLARPHADVTAALRSGEVRAVIVCPSNPFISVEPILSIPGMREAIKASGAPVVAVSPIIGGQAVKGPTAKMMRELGLKASSAGVAARYGNLLDGYIVDHADADAVGHIGARVTIAKTLMASLQDRETLARVALDTADALASRL